MSSSSPARVLWNSVLAAELVDKLHLVVGALLLGSGTPAFSGGTTARLRLLDIRTVDGSDNAVVQYEVPKS